MPTEDVKAWRVSKVDPSISSQRGVSGQTHWRTWRGNRRRPQDCSSLRGSSPSNCKSLMELMIWACMSLIQPGEKVGGGERGSEGSWTGKGKYRNPTPMLLTDFWERIHPLHHKKVITYNEQMCVKFEKALNLVNYSFKLQWWIHAVVTLVLTWQGVKTEVGTPLSKGLDSCTGSLTTRIRTTGGQTGRIGAGGWGWTANSASTNQEVNSLP